MSEIKIKAKSKDNEVTLYENRLLIKGKIEKTILMDVEKNISMENIKEVIFQKPGILNEGYIQFITNEHEQDTSILYFLKNELENITTIKNIIEEKIANPAKNMNLVNETISKRGLKTSLTGTANLSLDETDSSLAEKINESILQKMELIIGRPDILPDEKISQLRKLLDQVKN
jgi:hypothetical protein